MSETTPAGLPPTNWTESPSSWQTWMPLTSRAISICRDTDCIHSEGPKRIVVHFDYGQLANHL